MANNSDPDQQVDSVLYRAALDLVETQRFSVSSENAGKLKSFRALSEQHEKAVQQAEAVLDSASSFEALEKNLWWKLRLMLQVWGLRVSEAPRAASLGVVAIIGLSAWIAFSVTESVKDPSLPQTAAIDEEDLYQTSWGNRLEVTLNDGSQLWLDWRSELAVSYSDDERKVSLTRGGAVFKVTSNPERPFVVVSDNVSVVVTGTEFSVRTYESRVEVGVLEGSVRVQALEDSAGLGTGNHLTIHAGVLGDVSTRELNEIGAWRDGMLVFERRELTEAIAELSLYLPYKVDADFLLSSDRYVTGIYFVDEAEKGLVSLLQAHQLQTEPVNGGIRVREARPQRPTR